MWARGGSESLNGKTKGKKARSLGDTKNRKEKGGNGPRRKPE